MSDLLLPTGEFVSFPLGDHDHDLTLTEFTFADETVVAQAALAAGQPDVPPDTFYRVFRDGQGEDAPEVSEPAATRTVIGSIIEAAVATGRPDVAKAVVPYLHLGD